MVISWFGHSSFEIVSSRGKTIITDPYAPLSPKGLLFAPIDAMADYLTISHPHWDHSAAGQIAGTPVIIDKEGLFETNDGISFFGLKVYHDTESGKTRGDNIIFKINLDGETAVHLGDLGHIPENSIIEQLKNCDALMAPLGGIFTTGPEDVKKLVHAIAPKYVFPMHYSNPKCSFLKYTVENFTELFAEECPLIKTDRFDTGNRRDGSNIPKPPTIVILESIR